MKYRLEELKKGHPTFPDGRTDYSNAEKAPVTTVVLGCDGKILILKRSSEVTGYKDTWNFVSGYLDEDKEVKKKAVEEVQEETGVSKENISEIRKGEPYEFTDEELERTWIVFPVALELEEKPEVKLDWEHTDFKWIKPSRLSEFDTVPKLEKTFRKTR